MHFIFPPCLVVSVDQDVSELFLQNDLYKYCVLVRVWREPRVTIEESIDEAKSNKAKVETEWGHINLTLIQCRSSISKWVLRGGVISQSISGIDKRTRMCSLGPDVRSLGSDVAFRWPSLLSLLFYLDWSFCVCFTLKIIIVLSFVCGVFLCPREIYLKRNNLFFTILQPLILCKYTS